MSSYFEELDSFLRWEKSTEALGFKPIYVDMADDLIAGHILGRIVYWHLPDKHGKTKMRVWRDGYWWIARKREDWWPECRVKPRQADAALEKLCKQGLVEKKVWKFAGNPTTHIRIITSVFMQIWREELANLQIHATGFDASDSDAAEDDPQPGFGSPESVITKSRSRKVGSNESGISKSPDGDLIGTSVTALVTALGNQQQQAADANDAEVSDEPLRFQTLQHDSSPQQSRKTTTSPEQGARRRGVAAPDLSSAAALALGPMSSPFSQRLPAFDSLVNRLEADHVPRIEAARLVERWVESGAARLNDDDLLQGLLSEEIMKGSKTGAIALLRGRVQSRGENFDAGADECRYQLAVWPGRPEYQLSRDNPTRAKVLVRRILDAEPAPPRWIEAQMRERQAMELAASAEAAAIQRREEQDAAREQERSQYAPAYEAVLAAMAPQYQAAIRVEPGGMHAYIEKFHAKELQRQIRAHQVAPGHDATDADGDSAEQEAVAGLLDRLRSDLLEPNTLDVCRHTCGEWLEDDEWERAKQSALAQWSENRQAKSA